MIARHFSAVADQADYDLGTGFRVQTLSYIVHIIIVYEYGHTSIINHELLAVQGFRGTGFELHIPHYLRRSRLTALAFTAAPDSDRLDVLKSAPSLSSTYYLSTE